MDQLKRLEAIAEELSSLPPPGRSPRSTDGKTWVDVADGLESLIATLALGPEALEPSHGLQLTPNQNTGNSLAHYAAEVGSMRLIRALHRLGLSCRSRNKVRRTPLHLARDNSHSETASLILQLCYPPAERLINRDPSTLSVSTLNELPKACLDHRLGPLNGMTLTMYFVSLNRLDLVKWMMDHGADLTVVDDSNASIFHHLTLGGDPEPLEQEKENDKYAYAWQSRSEISLAYATHEVDADIESIMTDKSLTSGELESLALLAELLQWKTGALRKLIDQPNEMGDSPLMYFAECAASPCVLIWAIRLMNANGARLSQNRNSGMNLAMVVASRFGDGPWLEFVMKEFRIRSSSRDKEGHSLDDFLQEFDAMCRHELEAQDLKECESYSEADEKEIEGAAPPAIPGPLEVMMNLIWSSN